MEAKRGCKGGLFAISTTPGPVPLTLTVKLTVSAWRGAALGSQKTRAQLALQRLY